MSRWSWLMVGGASMLGVVAAVLGSGLLSGSTFSADTADALKHVNKIHHAARSVMRSRIYTDSELIHAEYDGIT